MHAVVVHPPILGIYAVENGEPFCKISSYFVLRSSNGIKLVVAAVL